MELGFNFKQGRILRARLPRLGAQARPWLPDMETGQEAEPLDWMGLRARFQAVHALRRSLNAAPTLPAPGGGFLAEADRVLDSCREQPFSINPISLGSGKSSAAMDAGVAVPSLPGDWGTE